MKHGHAVPIASALRGLSAYDAFAQSAKGDGGSSGVKSQMPEATSPVQQISRRFAFQSYFDDALLEKAILVGSPNDPIITSTADEPQIPGYAIGLAPWSQTPVAIEFRVGGQPSSSHAVTLKPGMIVRPHGLGKGGSSGQFSGFRWGLPFGWLGGGLAALTIFQTPDSDVLWPGNNEIIFHRQRMQITAAPTDARKNWPLRFPWTQALQGASAISQKGQANISVEPTKVLLSLRLTTLAAPTDMRILVQSSNDFDLDSAGNPIVTPGRFKDFTWGTFAPGPGAGNLATQYPVEFLPNEIVRLAADDGGIALGSAAAALIGAYVDITRYGRVG